MFLYPLLTSPIATDGDSLDTDIVLRGHNLTNELELIWFDMYSEPNSPYGVILHQSCRLLGVDAPEKLPLRSRRAANLVCKVTQNWVNTHTITHVIAKSLCSFSGRYIGDIYAGNLSLSRYLLQQGVVKPFKRTREDWTDKELLTVQSRCIEILSL